MTTKKMEVVIDRDQLNDDPLRVILFSTAYEPEDWQWPRDGCSGPDRRTPVRHRQAESRTGMYSLLAAGSTRATVLICAHPHRLLPLFDAPLEKD